MRRTSFLARLLARFGLPARQSDRPPASLSLLERAREPAAADWLRSSVTTFAESVASFLPGQFEAYARIHHPFQYGDGTVAPATSWKDLAAAAGVDLLDPALAAEFASTGIEGAQAAVGRLPPGLIGPLIEHLEPATTTPEHCHFALWEGFGDSPVPRTTQPVLELPYRRYHVFSGPLEGVRTSLFVSPIGHRSANLWWPADRAWCVATEVDFAWTYVGGSGSCISAILADARFDAVETSASARW